MVQNRKAFISGCAGPSLSPDEAAFFGDQRPLGLILFKRNCESPDQIRSLVDDFRIASGFDDALILVDQEGGRVQRLGPPTWRKYPPARRFGDLYLENAEAGRRAAWLVARLIADELFDVGFTVDCLPVLDVPQASVHDVIGDRGYSPDPGIVAVLGRAAADGLTAGGLLPVVKHLPGHGRVLVDSHHELPIVDAGREDLEDQDFRPFRELNTLPIGMTAHIVYSAIDGERPGTQSTAIIGEIIREDIGFDGLLLTDDLSMNALAGTLADRASGAFAAGADVALHCNGDFEEMCQVAQVTPKLEGRSLTRLETALAFRRAPEAFDSVDGFAELMELVGVPGT